MLFIDRAASTTRSPRCSTNSARAYPSPLDAPVMSHVLDFRSARPPVEDDCEARLDVCPASSMKSVDSLNDRHFLSASARVRSASAAARTASRPSKSRIGGSMHDPLV